MADDSYFKATCSPDESLRYNVTHVCLPVELPDKSDYTLENDRSLARAVCAAAHAYTKHVSGNSEIQWCHITRMLNNLQASVRSEHLDRDCVISQLRGMRTEDILAFLIRPHNSAIIFTKRESCTLFESFEVVPSSDAARETAESAMCSYLGRALEIPNELLDSQDFQLKLTGALSHPNITDPNYPHPPLAHMQFVTALFSGILRGVGRTINIPRITKCVCGDVLRSRDQPAKSLWRRSSLWLLIKVAIQSLDRSPLGRTSYKEFMLFFICTIATNPNLPVLSTDLLHSIASKILCRLNKLRSSIPDWLSQIALKASAGLQGIFEVKWMELGARSSPFRNPSQDELKRDTQLSLENSHEYIQNALANHPELAHTLFYPNHGCRGNIYDFLSSDGAFFDEAYNADPMVTLYDVEQLVEQGIDEWTTCVTNADDGCVQLEILMDKYMKSACSLENPEDISIMLLTAIELFVALDKLVVEEIPIFADYSPVIPIALLERLLLRRTTSLHRLSRAIQYLSARHSRSYLGWSLLSNEFTEDSFATRYYDESPHLQQLKARIDEDAMAAGGTQSPLPSLPLQAKVVVFELQCPACIRIWRSAVARVLQYHYDYDFFEGEREDNLLARVPALQQYFVDHNGPPLAVQVRFAFCYSGEQQLLQNGAGPHYAVQHTNKKDRLSVWEPRGGEGLGWYYFSYYLDCYNMEQYERGTSHTANKVLAAQAHCPADLSLDEFVTFGQLRSGGSLQWINILQGLHSRTLNLRSQDVHYLLAHAVFQVGPLDLSTGIWIWHQDLHEPSFCNSLLDELEDLFVGVPANSIDGIMMSTISLLLARVFISSPSKSVSERVIELLRRVRRKTFNWFEDLSYDLGKAPMNRERSDLLLHMAATCRSTFDVDSVIFSKLFHSTEDIDTLISGSLFIHALSQKHFGGNYSGGLLSRDRRLALIIEEILRNVILDDVSDYGIDLAVRKIFPNHKAGPNRWEQLEHPNGRWLTCQTRSAVRQPSQTVLLNLIDGTLRVDGQPVGGLPREIRDNSGYECIFHDQGFFSIPSNLQGMDFTTATTSRHKVHFSLRGHNPVVRAQCDPSKRVLEFIPASELQKDLPPALIDGHIHWLNLSTKVIEIRPLERLWEESPGNWRIDYGQHRVYRGHEILVNSRCPTTEMISRCFECLHIADKYAKHRSNNLLITASQIDTLQSTPMLRLSVSLPRYGLSFFVNEQGELESHDFKNMVYDEDQCPGTLPGLENILVLRQKLDLPEGLNSRRVLIPNGFIEKHGKHHFRVEADHRKSNFISSVKPLYHSYDVDMELGCLVGNGTLTSTGYLAHLHATTSCGWPDPLTDKTGAQEALRLFQSAACRSIMKVKDFDISAVWTSSRYPEIKSVLEALQLRHYWDPNLIYTESVCKELEWRAARRDAYQSWLLTGPPSTEDCIPYVGDNSTVLLPEELRLPISPQVTLDHLFLGRQAPELPHRSTLLHERHRESSDNIHELNQLLSSLSMNKPNSSFQQEYMALLEKSAQCVREDSRMTHKLMGKDTLYKHYAQCRVNYFDSLVSLEQSLGPTADPYEQVLYQFGRWPPVTADTLLRYLASTSPFQLPIQWKKSLISFALLLLDLQRARRLLLFALEAKEEELSKELENEGCDGWDPEEFPDWLLIQIQGNFLIRRAQAETAMEMMSPQSGANTVMQVNMGEGKSSVVIPIATAALANGKKLVRVIVPKALTVQTFELLVSRLGGLADRPIYHLPFSRSPEYRDGKVISLQIDDLHKFMSQCMTERGILLVQPEHVVSLKLMSVEEQMRNGRAAYPSPKPLVSMYKHITTALSGKWLLKDSFVNHIFRSSGRPPENDAARADYHDLSVRDGSDNASKWFSLRRWLDSHVRDILDESDEILRPRFQLIYTVGHQQHMDGYPDRWTITQQVLRLVKECADMLSRNHPSSMEYRRGPPGSFPHIRIVRTSDVGRHLIPLILDHVMAGRLPGVNVQDISCPVLQRAIHSFISDKNVSQIPETVKMVEEYAKRSDQSCMWGGLLLLRGLLTSNILLFALTERRWRIDYGLAQSSSWSPPPTMLAVPYRAKDVPAPNTQFGHPDITIILTCLSYYYGGLTKKQLRTSFEILIDEDDPATEYALWVKDYDDRTMPDTLRTLGEINLKSSEQWDNVVFPLFSRNQAAIDFYLSRVVFPQEAKEYPWKLVTSSWDLAEQQDNLITGFSGTNDSRWLLPMSIAQRNLDHQRGTDARVLAYLLRRENDFYIVINQNSKPETTHELLTIVVTQTPEIRVLLDVGAQVLESSNLQVAKIWLDIAHDAVGAVYFNEHDELMVVMRNGTSLPMASSPLSQQLDRCVVYLDHAHTRGTDIKLPIGSRAAVTLGPKLTKDSLVQGCMRMRKLGNGHSVMFFAPPEVDWSIRAVAAKKDPDIKVTTVDILCWAIRETWMDIEQQAPYWAQQGMNHKSRSEAWSRYCSGDLAPEQLSDAWLQSEHKSLEDLYAPCEIDDSTGTSLRALDPGIRQRCKDLGILSLPRIQMDEEQEREVSRERERERETELPPKADAEEHFLHPNVVVTITAEEFEFFSSLCHYDYDYIPERSAVEALSFD